MGNISIMIIDSDSTRMENLVAALMTHPDLHVVSSVTKRETAIKQLSLDPMVILLNADILKATAVSRFLRSVATKSPSTKVVVIHTELPEDSVLIEEIRHGVRGYLRTTDPPALVAKAVRGVVAGEIWAERRILAKAISQSMLMPETLLSHVPNLQPLTNREMDMLNMVLKGATNREIAEMSNISERTVKTHLYRVYRKLKVKSRAKAIALLSHS